jgi:NADH dehydrogenase
MEWKAVLAKQHKLRPEEFTLMVVEALPTILNMLDRKDAEKAERFMMKKGIQLKKGAPITEVTADHIILKDGSQIPTNTLIWTAGVKGTSDAADFGLEAARGQRLFANEYMQAKGSSEYCREDQEHTKTRIQKQLSRIYGFDRF